MAQSSNIVKRSTNMNGRRSENRPNCVSGCSTALTASMRKRNSASLRRLLTLAGMGPGAIENRDWPFVRSGSTHSVDVDGGKCATEADCPIVELQCEVAKLMDRMDGTVTRWDRVSVSAA